LSLRGFRVGVLLLIEIATDHVVIVPIVQELCRHLLDVFQSCLLNFDSLLLSIHMPMEIIIMLVVSHVDRHNHVCSELTMAEEA